MKVIFSSSTHPYTLTKHKKLQCAICISIQDLSIVYNLISFKSVMITCSVEMIAVSETD